jgi:hypothetical protein
MNRLSATDSFAPAFARVRAMLFSPFRLGAWLKVGLIGLLGGGAIVSGGSFNFRAPVIPRSVPHGDLPPNVEDIFRAIRSIHLADYFHIIVIVIGVIVAFALIFLYLFCRFRFILFDTVVTGEPDISRGWQKYGSQANRYFEFWLAFRLVTWGALVLIVGVPLWKAYKSGLFSGDNSLPMFFAIIASVALGAIVVSIAFAVVSTLAKDFVMPVMALDDLSVGDAWSAVWRVAASEPGAWAGYMGMKLLCAFGSSIALSIAFVIAILPALLVIGIPVGILAVLGVVAFKAIGAVFGIIIVCVAILLAVAGFICLLLILTAPISVFFTSYALYFFGGRYPKLAALLSPQPVPPAPISRAAVTQPLPQGP